MWDSPRALNMAAGFLVGLAALAFTAVGTMLVLRSDLFPVREVVVKTPLGKTSKADVVAKVNVTGNFFAASPADVRLALEQLPWVRRVEVRRVWPDRLEVALEEHVALARWGDAGLVNTYGERFAATSVEPMPVFAGPAGAEAEVTRRYRRFAELLAPLGEAPERVILTCWKSTPHRG